MRDDTGREVYHGYNEAELPILEGLLPADAGELRVLGQQWSRDAAALTPFTSGCVFQQPAKERAA